MFLSHYTCHFSITLHILDYHHNHTIYLFLPFFPYTNHHNNSYHPHINIFLCHDEVNLFFGLYTCYHLCTVMRSLFVGDIMRLGKFDACCVGFDRLARVQLIWSSLRVAIFWFFGCSVWLNDLLCGLQLRD